MIFYFSATGNSKHVAELLSAAIGDSRPTDMRTLSGSGRHIEINENESIGFVFPVHSWGMPKTLPEVIAGIKFKGYNPEKSYCYMVCSCGDDCGLTFRQWSKAAERAGLKASAGYSVFMPNTYVLLPGFDTDDSSLTEKKLNAAPKRIEEIAAMIRCRAIGDHTYHGRFSRMKSGLIYPVFIKTITDKPFHADNDKCVKCGKCRTACPTGNITTENGLPKWNGHCINCLACYHYCPAKCIDFGKMTRRKGQYHFK